MPKLIVQHLQDARVLHFISFLFCRGGVTVRVDVPYVCAQECVCVCVSGDSKGGGAVGGGGGGDL